LETKIIMKGKYSNSRRLDFLVLFFLIAINSCAQQKAIVIKSYSSYTERLPGNIPVGRNGEELFSGVDTVITVYLETTTKSLNWDSAWLNGKNYFIVVQNVSQQIIEVGVQKINRERIVMHPAKNHFLWQLYLQPLKGFKKAPVKTSENEILLKGKYKTKFFYQKAGNAIELEGIPSV